MLTPELGQLLGAPRGLCVPQYELSAVGQFSAVCLEEMGKIKLQI